MQHSAPIDRISNLPDELLCHILSFLPIKLAFTTTLLSKRWATLCYSLTDLRFEFYGNKDTFHRFCRFADTMMLSPRAANQPIKAFSLNYGVSVSCIDRQAFDKWVEAAKRCCVEKIHLTIFMHTLINPTFFTSQTLVVLKLDWVNLEYDNNLCFDLPLLKTLHLIFVRFQKKYHFMKLLNACPVLEDLHTSCPKYITLDENNEGEEEFKSLILSKLVRAEIGLKDVPCNVIKNVEFLCINKHVTLKNIPLFRNLIHIKLWFSNVFRGWDGVVEWIQRCPKLQILFIRKEKNRNLCKKDWECPISDVECVLSHLRSCTILNFEGSRNDLQFATYILLNARLLQDMTINVATCTSNQMLLGKNQIIEELSSCPRISPGCKLSFE